MFAGIISKHIFLLVISIVIVIVSAVVGWFMDKKRKQPPAYVDEMKDMSDIPGLKGELNYLL